MLERSNHQVFEPQVDKAKGAVKCVKEHQKVHQFLHLICATKDMDELVLHQSPALEILSKFEPKQFIHSLNTPTADEYKSSIKFYLPRYKLTLQLSGEELICKEISGYILKEQQQTDDVFRGCSKYLLLEKSSGIGPDLIVYPEGDIVRDSQGVVDVKVKDDCDADLLWYQYEFHPRFNFVETKQVCTLADTILYYRISHLRLHFRTTSEPSSSNATGGSSCSYILVTSR
jgi:hypothetical protein